jgi:hypothetical protein
MVSCHGLVLHVPPSLNNRCHPNWIQLGRSVFMLFRLKNWYPPYVFWVWIQVNLDWWAITIAKHRISYVSIILDDLAGGRYTPIELWPSLDHLFLAPNLGLDSGIVAWSRTWSLVGNYRAVLGSGTSTYLIDRFPRAESLPCAGSIPVDLQPRPILWYLVGSMPELNNDRP